MSDTLSRFSPDDVLADKPALKKKVCRALASVKNAEVDLTPEEADFLIAEGGGPDPEYHIPRQMFGYQGRALVVRKSPARASCWRL